MTMLAQQIVDEISQLMDQGEFTTAETQLQASVGEGQSSSAWWLLKGRLLARQGQPESALEHLDKAIELNSENREAMFLLAYYSEQSGDEETAVEMYEACVSKPPLSVNALINLAVLYEDDSRFEEAEMCLRKVLEVYPNHRRAQQFLKDILSAQNMFYDEDQERDREKRNAVLDIPISDFELSVRSRNCLKKMNIRTLGDLLRTSEAELLSYKNFGETSLNEIKAMLSQKGLRLGQAIDDPNAGLGGASGDQLPDVDPVLMGKSVNELELSVRSRKCLQRLGISTVGELASRSELDLLNAKNFGQTSLAEIRQRLAEFGLTLRKSDPRMKAPRPSNLATT
ncbi:MAG: DNA-directed RNA polymerase subunit alpha [Phycisphaerae bacterium]|nr:DNA-directed RNA polymerase subunit alpha [Phycisphaerae bacterium]